jgi:ApaG protein
MELAARNEYLAPVGLWVSVDQVFYQPAVDTPLDRPYYFVYYITIHNDMDVPVTIKGRKWVVTNQQGEIRALEGDGVVGHCPTIEAGEQFTYNSFHLVDTPVAVAEGSYLGLDALGHQVLARIPPFRMAVAERVAAFENELSV